MENLKVLSISSLSAHKTASLKAQIAILGSHVLPVPSVILNGVTSFENVVKCNVFSDQLLNSTFELAQQLNQKIILFIGYIYHENQVDIIIDSIKKHKEYIHSIIVDPISGDNGKAYIDRKVINRWPELLSLANWAFPNKTELLFYSGIPGNNSLNKHIASFRAKYPMCNFLVTSYEENGKIGLIGFINNTPYLRLHDKYPMKFDGSGDVFTSYFIKYVFFKKLELKEAVNKATDSTCKLLLRSIKNNCTELVIE